MSYSRSCGVSLAACGASECRCVPVDPEPLFGPQEPAHAFAPCDRPDCPICAHQQAVQRSIDTRE